MTYKMNALQGDEKFYRVYEGKIWAGRVFYDSIRKRWVGKIGNFTATGADPVEAFGEVGARVSGFSNAAEMHEHNVRVRDKRHKRTRARQNLARLLYGATDDERCSFLDDFVAAVRS